MLLPTIDDIDIKDKKVLLRLDFDFLFKRGFKITDYHELNLVIPTIKKLINENTRIIIAANYSNLKNKKSSEYSMENFATVFCNALNCEVYLTQERVGQIVNKISQDMVPGGILILNNFSEYPEETNNDPDFAKGLSEISDIYVNDAFTISDLKLASTTSILDYYEKEQVCFGYNFENEFKIMKSLDDDTHPFAVVLNTNLINDGIEIIENLIDKVDKLLLIGELSNVMLSAPQGTLKFDLPLNLKDKVECLLKSLRVRDISVLHPVDYFIEGGGGDPELVNREKLNNESIVLDIGDSTGNLFSEALTDVKKLVWFGPLPFKSENSLGGSTKIFETVEENDIFSIGLVKDPQRDYLKYSVASCFKYRSFCYDIYLKYIKNEALPVIDSIEARFK